MSVRYIRRNSGVPVGAVGKVDSSPFYVDSANSNIVTVIPASSGTTAVTLIDASSTQTLAAKTLTAPTITGAASISSAATVTTGGATSGPANIAGGLVDGSANASGSTQNTEYVLNTITLKANSFNANTRGVQVEFWGTLSANANAKNLKIYFGATAVVTVTGSTASGKDFYGCLNVVRTGASTQTAVGWIQVDTATSGTMAVNASVAETDTADIAITFKSANTAAAAASATGKGAIAFFTN